MYSVSKGVFSNKLFIESVPDGIVNKKFLFLNFQLPAYKKISTDFIDIAFSFGSNVVVTVPDNQEIPQYSASNLNYRHVNNDLLLYAENTQDLYHIQDSYRASNDCLKTYTPSDNIYNLDNALVGFDDCLDDLGYEVELINISEKEFRKRLKEIEDNNTTSLIPSYIPIYIFLISIGLFIAFIVLNLFAMKNN